MTLGRPLIEDKLTSCQTLKKSGNTKSMIYNLKGKSDQFPRLAYCDMENSEGYDDPSMETKLGYVLHSPYDQRPDVFTAYENGGSNPFKETYLTFSKSLINDGNVFDGTEFTCRMEGYYDFSFAGSAIGQTHHYKEIFVQKNGADILKFMDLDANYDFLMSFNWQMELKAGDKVRLKQNTQYGFLTDSNFYRIFNGKYIRPL